MKNKNIAIIGGGPSGLIAAEIIASAGHNVTIYDQMPSLGRKFLMAGRGGLNLTHSENLEKFLTRYNEASDWFKPHIQNFSPADLIAWCEGLGQEVFIGSSGRVFPKTLKAAPLLRAWLKRLGGLNVKFMARHSWQGWDGDKLLFKNNQDEIIHVQADATLLALGGASWPRLGSNGNWVEILEKENVKINPIRPANCGFIANWSENFSCRFAGAPLKAVKITHKGTATQGEVMITSNGLEGGGIYALSSHIRHSIEVEGQAMIELDLRPGMSIEKLAEKLRSPRAKQSFSNYLRKAGFSPVIIALLREVAVKDINYATPEELAQLIKCLPVKLIAITGIARAISSAGGIAREALSDDLMLLQRPGVFAAGEMLDWEAPTGGYLLQGCFSTGIAAAKGIVNYYSPK